MKIYLTAVLKSKPEHQDEVKAVLHHMVQHSRREAGCLQYDLHQGIDDTTLFTFYEIWESQEVLDLHQQQSYIREFADLAATKLQEAPAIYKTTLI